MIVVLGFVVLAGAGATTRALVGRALNPSGGFPLGTLLVNVAGSFALGAAAGLDAPAATLVGAALLGGLTTFSSFTRDAVALVEDGRPGGAAAYVLGTAALTVGAAAAGLALA